MKVTPAAAIVSLLVLLLTWLSLRAINPEAELFDLAFAALDRFAMLESALYRDVFTARAGTLRNYDPLVREINELHESLSRLRETAAIDSETTAALDQLVASVDQQEELVERFKSDNALLHNSLAGFRAVQRPSSLIGSGPDNQRRGCRDASPDARYLVGSCARRPRPAG